MKITIRSFIAILNAVLLLITFAGINVFAQAPLVYDVENTGASFAPPVLPTFDELPIIRPLPDPFVWSDGSDRSTDFSDWSHRRAEIKAEIEHYEIGEKPVRPDDITATYSSGTLKVYVTINGYTLTLTSQVVLPMGSGPFPAVIGMNSASGSIPSSVFSSRNIATIRFNANNVTTYGNPQPTNPYYRLYPDLNPSNTGQYSAWAWGVSRIIDGLELVQADLPIDLEHIAVTGCSYAGKMALFAGAFDERVALTIAQESGGGGAPAWRVSETLGNVETIGNTDYNWFADQLRQFIPLPDKLPYDHHELMAMVAPRALLVTGNTNYEWLANPSCYASTRATQQVYEEFGIGDRFGFYIDGGHGHCAVPASQLPSIEAFVEKFMLGNMTANTDVHVHPYPDYNYERWTQWWGTGDPTIPDFWVDPTGAETLYFETECANHGTDWETYTNEAASNGAYITIKAGLNSTSVPPTGPESTISIPFTVTMNTAYYFFARVNCPSASDDSYYMKIDDGPFVTVNGLGTVGWQWYPLTKFWTSVGQTTDLTAGDHTLTITYREDGALMDKLCITSYIYGPYELGGPDAGPTHQAVQSEVHELSMWPPDHDYQTIDLNELGLSIAYNYNCACASPDLIKIASVTSDEPENGNGDGNTLNDIVIADDFRSVDLRKERKGNGNGRVYTIHLGVFDCEWNIEPATVLVQVPHDASGTAIDDGPVYEVLGAESPELPKANSDATPPEVTRMDDASVPTEFDLKQNFPNPFNPTTTIQIAIAEAGNYTLKVYNTLGQVVTQLVNGQLDAGTYNVTFDASNLASGMYIYSLKGNNINLSKKLMLKR
ncbi:T9SS type A sorting domain-containing protein [candidate division KSB1 bacterium]|nr:T9SS type A sorting domain-containing protein [candidate division KSB1 bacterium]